MVRCQTAQPERVVRRKADLYSRSILWKDYWSLEPVKHINSLCEFIPRP